MKPRGKKINGTSVFEQGLADWCLTVAKIVHRQPVAGIISAPARRTPAMYGAYAEYDTYMNGELIAVSEKLTFGLHRGRIALKPPGEPVKVYISPNSMKPLPRLTETNESKRQ